MRYHIGRIILLAMIAVASILAARVHGVEEQREPEAYTFADLGLLLDTQVTLLRIDGVAPYSLAAEAGLMKGDVILAAEGERISTGNELNRILEEIPFGEVSLMISRRGQVGEIFVRLP